MHGVVFPDVSVITALEATGFGAAVGTTGAALKAGLNALGRHGTPERNAVSYLMKARPRQR
jgi:hypothetical protein